MRPIIILPAIASLVAAQGTAAPGNPPSGCTKDFNGKFQVGVGGAGKKRGLGARAECGGSDTLVATLVGGVMKDALGRTGSIVANYQFQFDGPPQAGVIYTGGFSICGNGSIALGSSTTFYQCKSGDFSNVYDRSWAAQCTPVGLVAVACGSSTGGGAGQVPDGQVTVGTSTVRTTVVRTLPDGQPQIITTAIPVPIKQIPDGQVQISTVKQISDGQVQVPTSAPRPPPVTTVKQISDGQIQVSSTPRPPPVTTVKQISDGQIQVSTPAPQPPPVTTVKQISDGQIQVTSSAPRPPPVTTAPPTTISTRVAPSNTTRPPIVTIPPNVAGRFSMEPVAAFVVGIVGALALL